MDTLVLKFVWKHLLSIVLAIALAFFALYHTFNSHNLQKQIIDLQNQAALKDKTIEEQKGLYEKLTVQTNNVQNLLNSKDTQIAELEAQAKKDDEQLSNATSISL